MLQLHVCKIIVHACIYDIIKLDQPDYCYPSLVFILLVHSLVPPPPPLGVELAQ